jgi:hypothetical protein
MKTIIRIVVDYLEFIEGFEKLLKNAGTSHDDFVDKRAWE